MTNMVTAQSPSLVQDVNFVADYYSTSAQGKYGVLVLGGSGGGNPSDLAIKISELGFPVLALSYFKEPSLPDELEQIPLEYFDEPKQWLMNHVDTRTDGLIVVGWSKGAELSLLLATKDSNIKGVIGIAPSSVVWAGILQDWTKVPKSSWTLNGESIPHVPFATGVQINSLTDLYLASLKNDSAVQQARIPVQNIFSPVLLLSGGKDEIWPADLMAQAVCTAINEQRDTPTCRHINYPEAGHLLDENIIIGGTKLSNAQANVASKLAMKQFLNAISD